MMLRSETKMILNLLLWLLLQEILTQAHQFPAHNHNVLHFNENPSQPVSKRRKLDTHALGCFDNSIPSKVEPKDFKTVDCSINAIQGESLEIYQLQVWKLASSSDCVMTIAHRWILQVKSIEHDEVLNIRHMDSLMVWWNFTSRGQSFKWQTS